MSVCCNRERRVKHHNADKGFSNLFDGVPLNTIQKCHYNIKNLLYLNKKDPNWKDWVRAGMKYIYIYIYIFCNAAYQQMYVD